jgi:hypothetical protein
MAERPKLFKIDGEMQRWCALLEEEVSGWPRVTAKPLFGMIGFYHGRSIFAAIPKTKAAGSARSVLIKLPNVSDARLKPVTGPGKKWIAFELESAADINEALQWLERAYEETSL